MLKESGRHQVGGEGASEGCGQLQSLQECGGSFGCGAGYSGCNRSFNSLGNGVYYNNLSFLCYHGNVLGNEDM